jgi:acetyl esterase/lipase
VINRTLIVVALLTVSAAAQQRGAAELASAPVPEGARRIAYGTDPMQFGELRLPARNGPHPVAIVVHGGCWVAKLRNYDEVAVSLAAMRPMANALTEAGVATWNIEYRRIDQPGGGWPGTFLDVAAAADFLRTIAAREQLDLTRVVAIGHSAGGHLAMWLAARAKVPVRSELYANDPLRLTGSINLDGPPDLKATLPVEKQICGSGVVTTMMGGTPDSQADRYRAGSPIEMLPFGGHQIMLAGAMFGAQAQPYADAARKAGDRFEDKVYEKAGHFLFIDPESAIWPDVLTAVRQTLSIKP